MTIVYGGKANKYWKTYMDYTITNNTKNVVISFNYGIYGIVGHGQTKSKQSSSTYCSGFGRSGVKKYSGGETRISAKEHYKLGSASYTVNKGTYSKSVTFAAAASYKSSTGIDGGSEASQTITVGALPSYAVKYYANAPSGRGVSGVPSAQTKYYDINLSLSSGRPTCNGYAFKGWATTAGGGVAYQPSNTFTGNYALNLYAVWAIDTPPTIKADNIVISSGYKNGNNALRNMSQLSVTVTDATVKSGRTISSIVLKVGSYTATRTSTGTFTWDASTAGTFSGTVTITDSANLTATVSVGSITVENPTWNATFTVNQPPPQILSNGQVVLQSAQIMKSDGSYEALTSPIYGTKIDDSSWEFSYTFDEAHYDAEHNKVGIKILQYDSYTAYEKEFRNAFFATTRNCNFSNGIYNTMFVSGAVGQPNYTSRVWWSEINNPLYFPDTNYIEVGSNDTSVMGLAKIGNYLGAVKQSKTTDTAIYLIYPTSFDENTTYAVRQGVQGVGAIGKYTFNILGDETLFLSPRGVMAVSLSADEDHKVQNRSYFVDGKLLQEDGLADAYSFVFDGMYWLSIGNGHCYVLDGNQRNSWGNDRTNLVYECYYLENIPAHCFVKYGDNLIFSDDANVCQFTKGQYIDSYDADGNENVIVSAEWSTLLDDDGALHYNKTMQKKGNLVSILPTDFKWVEADVDETTFNANKKQYYVLVNDEHVQCDKDSVYDAGTTYYIRDRGNTKVYVKKDQNKEVEIERKFSESSDIPSEMFLNKKFKKYKRLQFIVRNEENEPFGLDSIIKNYTVGNYAKR